MSTPTDTELAWTERWIDSVTTGKTAMSQRKLVSIARFGGGLTVATAAAHARGIHLLELTDDKGETLIAASRHPFKVLC